jgi:hypothetical protein
LSVYGPDWAGNDVILGYGTTHLPIAPGRYVRCNYPFAIIDIRYDVSRLDVRLFTPLSNSFMNEIGGFLTGQRTEYKDIKFVCGTEGRQGNTRSTSDQSMYSSYF